MLRYSSGISEFTEKESVLVLKMLEKRFCGSEVLRFEYSTVQPSFALNHWSRSGSMTCHRGVVSQTRKSLPPHSKLTTQRAIVVIHHISAPSQVQSCLKLIEITFLQITIKLKSLHCMYFLEKTLLFY